MDYLIYLFYKYFPFVMFFFCWLLIIAMVVSDVILRSDNCIDRKISEWESENSTDKEDDK